VSLRRRLLLAFVAVAAVLAVADVVIIRTVESNLLGQIDQRLSTTVPRIAGPGGDLAMLSASGCRPAPDAPDGSLSELYMAELSSSTGCLTVFSEGLGADQPAPQLDANVIADRLSATTTQVSDPFTVASEGDDGARWRLVVTRSPSGDVNIWGLPLSATEATITNLTVLTLAASGAVLVVLGLVGWWVIRLGLRPIDALVRTADEIAAGDLSRRLDPQPDGTEAGHLTEAFNGMIHQIEEAFAEREASEDRLRRFVADASHELRTPLTSIRGYTDLMRAGALDDPGARSDALRRVSGETARMAELVDDLLVLARLDQGRPLEQAPVDLVAVVSDAVQDAGAVAPGQPVTLTVPGHPVVVVGDEGRLRQVVANLLTNARVHTPRGTPITVRVDVGPGTAELVVADEGEGMAPEVATRVFERFYRADPSRSRDRGGSGLGLSIVAAVAQAHGGLARVESTPGTGTRVLVSLPLT
jgi:two-component system OmpR family sensor kinase